jgi:preprotein translocase subunit YajC
MQFLILPLLLLAMYFLVIRPQQQRIRAQQAVVASLEEGDEVISSAGIYGRITSLGDDIVTLEVADGVELRLARGAIARRLTEPEPEPVLDLDDTDDEDDEDDDGLAEDDELVEDDEPGTAR